MGADTGRWALLHLVCSGCAARVNEHQDVTANGLEHRTLRRALLGSVRRLLDAPLFAKGLLDANDLSWTGKENKTVAERIPGADDANQSITTDNSVSGVTEHRNDWSSVGFDPKYRAVRRLHEQEELRFVALAKAGDRFSRQKLIVHHLPLLKMVARRYNDKGLSLSELVNEGTFGLVRAIERFDISRKLRFGTYAKWWIRDAIEQALLNQSRLIRLPGYVVRSRGQQSCAGTRQLDSEPEIPGEGTSHGVFAEPVARDFIEFENTESGWDEYAEDKTEGVEEVTPETVFDDKQRRRLLELGLARLSERERCIVVRRFGLYNDTADTLEIVASDLGVSYERVRQIQKSALAKLKRFLTSESPGRKNNTDR